MRLWAGLALLGVVFLAAPGPAFEARDPIGFAPLGRGGVAVLEDLAGRVRIVGGGEDGQVLPGLERPAAVAADEQGLLLVLTGTGGLAAYRDGRSVWRVTLRGEVMPGSPVDLAAREGIVWVLDRAPARLLLFAYDGASLGWVDLQERARAPFDVALGPSGEAFVSDPLGPAVFAFSPSGSYAGDLGLAETGITRPTGLAVDGDGQVWVSDGVTGLLVLLDPTGKRPARSAGSRFVDPVRLAWRDHTLWVLEGRPGRIREVQLEGP